MGVEVGIVGSKVQAGEWVLLTQDPEAVLSALERGETDGILPAATGIMDRFGQFMVRLDIPVILDQFPDHRKRKWITPFLFCNTLLHKSLFRLGSLTEIGPFLFSSPDVMRALGFQMRQIRDGFYTGSSQRPFNEESMSDFFAICSLGDFLDNQRAVLKALVRAHPEIFEDGSLIMDCLDVRIPAGHMGRPQIHIEACVLCLMSQGELLPVLWSFTPANTQADITQGKALIQAARPILSRKIKRIIVDRGFMSGAWMTELKMRGIDTVIGLRRDMALHEDMVALSRLPDTTWLDVDPPKYHKGEVPRRQIAYFDHLETWEECKVTLAGIVIRDSYADKTLLYTVVTTDRAATPAQIHAWIRSRWQVEETFMQQSRYGCFNRLGSCRPSVAAACVHFSLLAYTLIRLFARHEELEASDLRLTLPTSGVLFVAYWREYYAIILPSQLVELVARCASSWGDRLPAILEKLKALERPP